MRKLYSLAILIPWDYLEKNLTVYCALKKVMLSLTPAVALLANGFEQDKKLPVDIFSEIESGKIESGKTANTPIIDTTLKEFEPDLVIIEMGGNYTNRSDSYSIKDIDELVNLIIENKAKMPFLGWNTFF